MLYFGAEWLVKGSSSLAQDLGVKRIVIGLTVVAFGTSAPELVISLVSAVQGKSMIAVGNVIGSNICNIALVLGLAAVFHPITSNRSVVRRDIPIMLGISLYLLALTFNGRLGRIEGGTLVGGLILYVYFNYAISVRESKERSGVEIESPETDLEPVRQKNVRAKQLLLIVVGIGGVVAGAQIVVDCAVKMMTILGVNEKFIGLTIVAFGTSLPELATSVIAAIKKEMDISIGNLIGSNVFNIMGVLGVSSLITPIVIHGGFVESGLLIDYLVMMLSSLFPWVMMRKDCTLTLKEGVTLLLFYTGYIVYLVAS